VFVLAAGQVPADDAVLLKAAARVVLGGGRGALAQQLERPPESVVLSPALAATASPVPSEPARPAAPPEGLLFWNGLGGFTPDGREYLIAIDAVPTLPPAPWTNVLANPGFGCLVTEAGLGYSWAGNSQMNRLTPWSNDPVSDPPGEAVYLRDEETGEVWTPTPLPRGAGAAVTVRHGQGYTRYTRQSHGLEQDLLVLVPPDDPVKLVRLTCATPATGPGDSRRRSTPSGCSGPSGTTRHCRSCASATRRPGPSWPAAPGRAASPASSPSRPWGRGRTPPRRPDRVPGPQRLAVQPCRSRPRRPVRPHRAGARPVRRAHDADHPGPRPDGRGRLRPGAGGHAGTSAATGRDLHRPRAGPAGAGRGAGAVGPRAGCRSSEDPRRRRGRDDEPLAALPDPGLPGLGRSAFYQSGGPTASATSSRT
jgi:Cellobiose phosphorylase